MPPGSTAHASWMSRWSQVRRRVTCRASPACRGGTHGRHALRRVPVRRQVVVPAGVYHTRIRPAGPVNAGAPRDLSDGLTLHHPRVTLRQSDDTASATALDPEAEAIDGLVDQARVGDLDAFARLVRVLHPRVHRWALAFAFDGDEADDIAQEVFVVALRQLRQYRGGGAFTVWLYQITRRAAGHLRRKRTRRARLSRGTGVLPDREVYETDPGGRVDRERLATLVRRYWEELPERQRVVIDLVDLQGHTPADAAALLELNPATLRANLFKARQAMRRRMLAQFGGDFPGTAR